MLWRWVQCTSVALMLVCWQMDLRIACRSGVYIRSIARDLGNLMCGEPATPGGAVALSSHPDDDTGGIGAATRRIRRTNSSGFRLRCVCVCVLCVRGGEYNHAALASALGMLWL